MAKSHGSTAKLHRPHAVNSNERVVVLFASAKRDKRKYQDPDRFDFERVMSDQIAFGHGVHVCAGAAPARMEALSILSAMTRRIDRIEIHGSSQPLNNLIRSLGALEVTFH
jgi:cytochrome P450